MSLLREKFTRWWNGDETPTVMAAEWQAMMDRQGFFEPMPIADHLLRLEARITELERKA